MSKRYFTDNNNYPKILQAVIERSLLYIAETIYPDEYVIDPYKTISDRFVLSNIDSGEGVNIGDAVEQLKKNQGLIPFTAYQVGEYDLLDDPSVYAITAGDVYCPELNCYIASFPMKEELKLVTFYSTPSDYNQAKKLLHWADSSLTRLLTPIMLLGKEYFLPVDLEFEISRGSFAFDYEQQLESDNIFSLYHTVTIKYFDVILDQDNIALVDDIIVSLNNYYNSVIETVSIEYSPRITSHEPATGSQHVDRDSHIILSFNHSMNKQSVESSFQIIPMISGIFSWNTNGTEMEFAPSSQLFTDKEYIVIIGRSACSLAGVEMGYDHSFNFHTN